MKAKHIVQTTGAIASAITNVSSTTVSTALVPQTLYAVRATVACWIKQGFGAQTAAAATANNVLIPLGEVTFISGSNGETISAIGDVAIGSISLSVAVEI